MKTARTPVLDIAYEESGPAGRRSAVLLHGFRTMVMPMTGAVPPLVGIVVAELPVRPCDL